MAWQKELKEQDEYLIYLAFEGLEKLNKSENKIYEDRLCLELQRIIDKGYSNYFLIMWDIVNFCKEKDIMIGACRGSVGACLVAYCLGITKIDPIKFNLLFDRFISEIRRDFVDIDTDFADNRRDEVIKYLEMKYKNNHLTKVVTYSRFHGKGVLRDIGRIFDIPAYETSKIANMILQRCISGNSKILLTNGTEKTIKKLYNEYKNNIYGHGKLGKNRAYAISWDLNKNRFIKQSIKNIYHAGKKQMYEIILSSGKKIEASEEHKFLTRNGWKKLKELSPNDEIMTYSESIDYVKCKICNKILREVNLDHLRKHNVTKKEYYERFKTKDVCKEVSIKKGWQLGKPYIGRKLFGKDNPMSNKKTKEKWYKKINDIERRKKHSKFMKKNNPMFDKKTASKVMKNFSKIFKKGSKPQRKLYRIIRKNYSGKMRFDFYVKTERSFRFLDVALIDDNIDFEFDGSFWHQNNNNRRDDKRRAKELNEIGWIVISIDDKKLNEKFIINKLKELKCLRK